MAAITLRGMTWDHRRAVAPLLATLPAFQAAHPDVAVTWEARSLHGFEFEPVPALAERYDLIVLDHPFCGEIARSACLLPLDGKVPGLADGDFVGPSLASYRYAGRVWALPIDAACQVAASRPDLMARLDEPPPASWEEVLRLGQSARRKGLRLAVALKGVHALMTFFTLCAGLGKPCGTRPEEPFCDAAAAREALAALRALVALVPVEALGWSSIQLHDAMARADDLAYCPAVYCYATYAEADQRRPLRFHDLPGLAGGPQGSTLGGTGLGISAATRHPEAALAYARHLAAPATQCAFAAAHGQPAHRAAWEDPEIDGRFGGCFAATRRTMDGCWIRPRYDGYLAFQAAAGPLMEAHLRRQGVNEAILLRQLAELHAQPRTSSSTTAPR